MKTNLRKTLICILILVLSIPFFASSQEVKVYNLRNCQSEMRTVTFQSQLNTFNWWVFGKTNLKDQRIFVFSPSYKLDSNYLNKQVQKVREKLPASFFKPNPFLGDWHENIPDEPSIWFLQVYANKDKNGKFNALAAVRFVFEGEDARLDRNRAKAAIKDIVFIFDKQELGEIAQMLQATQPL